MQIDCKSAETLKYSICLLRSQNPVSALVFTNEFGSDTFTKDVEECQEIAEKILSSVV